MARSYQSEVVDDSEPEREELRIQERCERKYGFKDRIQYQTMAPLAVAEIPDDGFMDGQGPISGPSKISVELTNVELTHRTHPAVQDNPRQTLDDTRSSTDEDEPKISLARFAHPGAVTTRKTSIVGTGLARQASSISSIVETKPPAKRSAHRFAGHFSDSDLGKVTKCVSCDIRWTARKTASQKILHIQSCAKKKGLTDETVQILLHKEIEFRMADIAPHRGKGKEKTADSETFFEKVLAETAPKRKTRRKEVGETVKTISQTRELILERARAIIAPTSRHNDDRESPLHSQILCAFESHCDDIPPPPTQAFGNSALVQARQTKKLFDYDTGESSDNENPRDKTPFNSPTFAPSRLGRHLSTERPIISTAHHLSVRPLTFVDFTYDSPRKRVLNARAKISPRRPSESPPFSQLLSSPERDNGNDDVFLHFDPESVNDMPSTPIQNRQGSDLLKASSSKIRSRTPTKSKSDAATTLTSSSKTKTPSSKRVKTPAKKKSLLDDETVENLKLKLKDKILEDTDLHLRILRYEPIHFDVFLKLMLGDSFPSASNKARLRIRSLLDNQAIHFYGSEKKRRRRR